MAYCRKRTKQWVENFSNSNKTEIVFNLNREKKTKTVFKPIIRKKHDTIYYNLPK